MVTKGLVCRIGLLIIALGYLVAQSFLIYRNYKNNSVGIDFDSSLLTCISWGLLIGMNSSVVTTILLELFKVYKKVIYALVQITICAAVSFCIDLAGLLVYRANDLLYFEGFRMILWINLSGVIFSLLVNALILWHVNKQPTFKTEYDPIPDF